MWKLLVGSVALEGQHRQQQHDSSSTVPPLPTHLPPLGLLRLSPWYPLLSKKNTSPSSTPDHHQKQDTHFSLFPFRWFSFTPTSVLSFFNSQSPPFLLSSCEPSFSSLPQLQSCSNNISPTNSPINSDNITNNPTNPIKSLFTPKEFITLLKKKLEEVRSEPKNVWPRVSIASDGLSIRFSVNSTTDVMMLLDVVITGCGTPCSPPQEHHQQQKQQDFQMNVVCEQLGRGWKSFSFENEEMNVVVCRQQQTGQTEIMFSKEHKPPGEVIFWSTNELWAIVQAYLYGNESVERSGRELEELGLKIFPPDKKLSWDSLGGYDAVKSRIQNTVLLALQHPSAFETVMRGTRKNPSSSATNRPKAVLFEGPPGTGKTTTARIIAASTEIPLVYLPVEKVVSMYYGQSEQTLAKVFEACEKLGCCVLFIDELDSLATSRSGEMHEATRRLLSVLLRKIEGFEQKNNAIVIGATNRKCDLDEALVSRFDLSIEFALPNEKERKLIFANYAQHLSSDELSFLASKSRGMSGRDIQDLCAEAERIFVAAEINSGSTIFTSPFELRGQGRKEREKWEENKGPLPAMRDYEEALSLRKALRT